MYEDDKIYVRFIYGLLEWVPVNAREIKHEVFEILPDDIYNDLDRCELFEFYPGDIVRVEQSECVDDDYQYKAISLISTPDINERLYKEFLFYSVTDQIANYYEATEEYRSVLKRIRQEIIDGLFVYKRIRIALEYYER